MCNLSEAIEASGIEKGIQQGIEKGMQQVILELIQSNIITPEQGAKQLDISVSDLKKLLDK